MSKPLLIFSTILFILLICLVFYKGRGTIVEVKRYNNVSLLVKNITNGRRPYVYLIGKCGNDSVFTRNEYAYFAIYNLVVGDTVNLPYLEKYTYKRYSGQTYFEFSKVNLINYTLK